jgi:hypothetical protein
MIMKRTSRDYAEALAVPLSQAEIAAKLGILPSVVSRAILPAGRAWPGPPAPR